MRLQKYLAMAGVASRRASEEIILAGRVSVNGKIVSQLGTSVDDGDIVKLDGKTIDIQAEKHYIVYNKPMGEVCTAKDELNRKTVMDKFADYPVRLFPIGRLDFNSEGLLLLTNDGELSNKMLHPSRMVDKVYLARINEALTKEDIRKLTTGVYIDGYKTAPARLSQLRVEEDYADISIVIHEGKNRQVRKMIEAVGKSVLLLKRVRFGPIELGDLPRGKWRRLSDRELHKLEKLLK